MPLKPAPTIATFTAAMIPDQLPDWLAGQLSGSTRAASISSGSVDRPAGGPDQRRGHARQDLLERRRRRQEHDVVGERLGQQDAVQRLGGAVVVGAALDRQPPHRPDHLLEPAGRRDRDVGGAHAVARVPPVVVGARRHHDLVPRTGDAGGRRRAGSSAHPRSPRTSPPGWGAGAGPAGAPWAGPAARPSDRRRRCPRRRPATGPIRR